MKKNIYLLFFISVALILASNTLLPKKVISVFSLVSKEKTFIAGTKITLKFKTKSVDKPQLFLIHSYGKTLLEGNLNKDQITFLLPGIYARKTGKVDWFLIVNGEKKMQGNFEILPNNQTKTQIENHIGPPSTLVGDGHFVMYVAVPTDDFDNPKPTNTPVIYKSQFLNSFTNGIILTKDLIAWKDFYAPTKSGLILLSSECEKTITKEYDAVIYPGIATNFIVNYTRHHEYADGNQITTLKTSIIRDKFGNIVSDGTMVSFMITTQNKMVLKSFGTTIDGVATAKILHPDHQDIFVIKAFVTGTAESAVIAINYKPINPIIEYKFSKDNRTLIVGPLRSFMNQLVPDGIKVKLKILHNNQLVETLQEDSSKGKATFNISYDYYKEKNYSFEISTLGKTLKTEEKIYDINKQ
jgi:hypothetical protein